MSKYIRKARRAELANAGRQMTFDLTEHPGQFVPDSKVRKTERRLMLRTNDMSLRVLSSGTYMKDEPCPVRIINDFVSSRRGKHDADNEHSLWTRYDLLTRDLNPIYGRCRKNGIKARLVTKDYPEGVLVTCQSVVLTTDDDPLAFVVKVTNDVR